MISQNNIFHSSQLLDDDIFISLDDRSMPLNGMLSKVGRCIVSFCLKGWADMEVNLVKHRFCESEIMILFPTQIVEQTRVSDDFSVMYFSLSPTIFQEVCFRFPPEFITFLVQHFFYRVTNNLLQEEIVRFSVLRNKFDDVENCCRREIILNMLRIYFLELYDMIQRDELANPTSRHNRKTEIFERFTHLVMQNFRTNRDVSFYAGELCISAKYLSMVSMEISGFNAKQWIDDYVILEIKIRLRSTHDTLQQIADNFNFADQAFLSKYFKQRTGFSPSDYRKTFENQL